MTGRGQAETTVSLPWPIRLFGDLQDDLGLPAIVAAVEFRTVVRAVPRNDGAFSIATKDLSEPLLLDPGAQNNYASQVPLLVKALLAVRNRKFSLKSGYDFHVDSWAPGKDCSMSSPGMTATWTMALSALTGALRELSGEEMVQIVAAALAGEWGLPEISAALFGGILLGGRGEASGSTPFAHDLSGLVLGYCPGASAADMDAILQRTAEAVAQINDLLGPADFASAPFDEIVVQLQHLSEDHARAVYAHLMMRNHCRRARQLLEAEEHIDDDRIGELLDGSHEMLRDHLGLREDELEKLLDAAVAVGALGCKMIPGTMQFIVFAPGKVQEVIKAIEKAGGAAGEAAVSDGMHVE